jgi:hypothetical protein
MTQTSSTSHACVDITTLDAVNSDASLYTWLSQFPSEKEYINQPDVITIWQLPGDFAVEYNDGPSTWTCDMLGGSTSWKLAVQDIRTHFQSLYAVIKEPSILAASFTERLRRMYEEAVRYGLEFDSAATNQKAVTFVNNDNSTQVTYYHDTNASRCKYHQIVDVSADPQTSCRITIESTGSNYESCYKNAIVALSGITHPQDVMATLISDIAHRDNN